MNAKILYTVEEACDAIGIKRSLLYELVQRGEIPTRKIGRRRLFPVDALRRWCDGDPVEDAEVLPVRRRVA